MAITRREREVHLLSSRRTDTYLAARFAIIDEMDFTPDAELRGTAAGIFRRIYWDAALAASARVLSMPGYCARRRTGFGAESRRNT